MDKRSSLPEGANLSFPGNMVCTVLAEEGRGSNAIVYRAEYGDAQFPEYKHQVLIKELFPFHPEGKIYRDSKNRICWDTEAAKMMDLHKLSFCRGNEVHLRLLGSFPGETGANLNTFSLNNTLYSVLGFSGARTLQKELENKKSQNAPLTLHIKRMLNALATLTAFHQSGYVHLDISPDNILLIGDGRQERISLIDYNSVLTVKELQVGYPLFFSEKEGYSAPEVKAGQLSRIGPWTDLYSLSAVFYRCLTGKSLTILETSQAGPPEISDVPCLKDVPATAFSLRRRILTRGLASTPSRRYRNTMEFQKDLEELQDRIEGRGITHWALWEAGRTAVNRILRENTAYNFVKEKDKLYPIQCVGQDGDTGYFDIFVKQMIAPGGRSSILLAGGGAGKTTTLLSAASSQPSSYRPSEPAVIYLPLYGWREGDKSYIIDRILENLLFTPETENMEMARHELYTFLSAPLYTKWGERPQLLLLLDGLNEVSGNPAVLLRELNELSKLPGVRFCVSSRSEIEFPELYRLKIVPLEREEVRRLLAREGLLLPEEESVVRALSNPFLLSLFIETAKDKEKQLFLRSTKELVEAYFSAIVEKSKKVSADYSNLHWQEEAAIYFVLPEIVHSINKKGMPLPDTALLPIVEDCWRQLSRREIRKVFPQWIGYIPSIRGDADDAEKWYATIVHSILWRRLGLLVRDRQGNYRLFHSMLEEYLLELRSAFHQKFVKMKKQRLAVLLLALLLTCGAGYKLSLALLKNQQQAVEKVFLPYDMEKAEAVLDAGLDALACAADLFRVMEEYLEELRTEPLREESLQTCLEACYLSFQQCETYNVEARIILAEDLLKTGEVMPWSGKMFDIDTYKVLMNMPIGQVARYKACISALEQLRSTGVIRNDDSKTYMENLSYALKTDAYLLYKIYEILLDPEYSVMEDDILLVDRIKLKSIGETLTMKKSADQETLQEYELMQRAAWSTVMTNPITAMTEFEG